LFFAALHFVRLWPKASFRGSAAIGRFAAKADIALQEISATTPNQRPFFSRVPRTGSDRRSHSSATMDGT